MPDLSSAGVRAPVLPPPITPQSHRGAPDEYLGLAQSYKLFDEPGDGAEVFSLSRDSELAPEEYLNTFFATGSERTATMISDSTDEARNRNTDVRFGIEDLLERWRRVAAVRANPLTPEVESRCAGFVPVRTPAYGTRAGDGSFHRIG